MLTSSPKKSGGADGPGRLIVGAILVFVFAFSLRFANLNHEPVPDELYHLLAAKSWVETGTFAVADGEYTRASVFTRLVGMVYAATGGDIDSIRILCILIGTVLVVTVFVSVWRLVGRYEAWVAAIMLSIMPGAIFLSQFIRFYSFHALSFWLAAILLYAVVVRPMATQKKVLLLIVAGALFGFSLHLQKTTIVGLAAIFAWLVAISIPDLWRWFFAQNRNRKAIASAALVLIIVAGFAALMGPFSDLVEGYLSASLWSSESRVSYYAIRYRDQYGLFWSLFPAAVVVALFANWKPAFLLRLPVHDHVHSPLVRRDAHRTLPFLCDAILRDDLGNCVNLYGAADLPSCQRHIERGAVVEFSGTGTRGGIRDSGGRAGCLGDSNDNRHGTGRANGLG